MIEMSPKVAVGILVINKDRILLGERHPALPAGGFWSIPIGRLEWGEMIKECGLRELKEESGLTAENLRFISIHNVVLPESHFLTMCLLAEGVKGEPGVTSPQEIVQWKWFKTSNLPNPLLYPIQDMIRAYEEQKNEGFSDCVNLNKWLLEARNILL